MHECVQDIINVSKTLTTREAPTRGSQSGGLNTVRWTVNERVLQHTKELCSSLPLDSTIQPEDIVRALGAGNTVSKVVRSIAKVVLGR